MGKRRVPKKAKPKGTIPPRVIILAGPNGAGKSTAAPRLLKGVYRVTEFLNADLIARGLSPFDPDGVALAASEIMIRRMEQLAAQRVSFVWRRRWRPDPWPPECASCLHAGTSFTSSSSGFRPLTLQWPA